MFQSVQKNSISRIFSKSQKRSHLKYMGEGFRPHTNHTHLFFVRVPRFWQEIPLWGWKMVKGKWLVQWDTQPPKPKERSAQCLGCWLLCPGVVPRAEPSQAKPTVVCLSPHSKWVYSCTNPLQTECLGFLWGNPHFFQSFQPEMPSTSIDLSSKGFCFPSVVHWPNCQYFTSSKGNP